MDAAPNAPPWGCAPLATPGHRTRATRHSSDPAGPTTRKRVKGDGIYAHVAAASGLGRAGQLEAEEIAGIVKRVGTLLEEGHIEKPIADALDLAPADAGAVKGGCRTGTLILANACLRSGDSGTSRSCG